MTIDKQNFDNELARIESAVIDRVCIGDNESEKNHVFESVDSILKEAPSPFTHFREASGRFSYFLGCLPNQAMQLHVIYLSSNRTNRWFDIHVDFMHLSTVRLTPQHSV